MREHQKPLEGEDNRPFLHLKFKKVKIFIAAFLN